MGAIIIGRTSSAAQDHEQRRQHGHNSPRKRVVLSPPISLSFSLYVSLFLSCFRSTSTPGMEGPAGLPRRNMLARTSDTLGFDVCHAVLIIPRRIPSAGYLSLGTHAGDIMWESKRIRRSRASRDATFLRGVKTRKGMSHTESRRRWWPWFMLLILESRGFFI